MSSQTHHILTLLYSKNMTRDYYKTISSILYFIVFNLSFNNAMIRGIFNKKYEIFINSNPGEDPQRTRPVPDPCKRQLFGLDFGLHMMKHFTFIDTKPRQRRNARENWNKIKCWNKIKVVYIKFTPKKIILLLFWGQGRPVLNWVSMSRFFPVFMHE